MRYLSEYYLVLEDERYERVGAPVKTRIDAAFVDDNVETVAETATGEYTVALTNRPFE